MSREISGLHEAAYILATFAILSQILALFRDKLFALFFGAGDMLDVYYSAFRIPDLLFVSIGSIVSASILLPYLMSHFEKGKEDGNRFADQIFTVFFSLIIVFGIVVFFFAPRLVEWLLPGFRYDPHLNDLITMTRIMLLSPVLLGLSNLYSSLTQMNHRFLLYALSPILYNISIILGVVILYPIMGITGLAIGVVIGAFLHLFVQVPYMKREGLVPSFTLSIEWKKIGRIFANALPRMVTLSSSQLATFFLVSLASLMAVGSISVFTLAFNLLSVPLTIIGASYTSAVFPSLSRLIVQGKRQEFLEKIIASAQHIIFWSVPLMILFVVLRAQIVRVIYGAGAFDWNDTKLTAAVLALFVISTVAQSLILLFVRSYYAEGKTAQPLLISIISGALIAIFGYLFVKIFFLFPMFKFFVESLLRVQGQRGTSVLMLALAYSLGVLINMVVMWIFFEKKNRGFSKPVLSTLFHSLSASIIMGYMTFLSLRVFANIFPLTKVWGVFLQGLFSGIIGIAVGITVLHLLRNKELHEVAKTLHTRIWKTNVPPPEVEHI
jgi:putative peptidoglycan lipid II flippase